MHCARFTKCRYVSFLHLVLYPLLQIDYDEAINHNKAQTFKDLKEAQKLAKALQGQNDDLGSEVVRLRAMQLAADHGTGLAAGPSSAADASVGTLGLGSPSANTHATLLETEAECIKLRDEADATRVQVLQLARTLDKLTSQHADTRHQLDAALSQLSAAKQEAEQQSQRSSVEAECQQLREAADSSNLRIAELTRDLDALSSRYEDARQKLQASSSAPSPPIAMAEVAGQELMTAELTSLRQQLLEAQSALQRETALREAAESVNSDCRREQSRADDLSRQLADLQQQQQHASPALCPSCSSSTAPGSTASSLTGPRLPSSPPAGTAVHSSRSTTSQHGPSSSSRGRSASPRHRPSTVSVSPRLPAASAASSASASSAAGKRVASPRRGRSGSIAHAHGQHVYSGSFSASAASPSATPGQPTFITRKEAMEERNASLLASKIAELEAVVARQEQQIIAAHDELEAERAKVASADCAADMHAPSPAVSASDTAPSSPGKRPSTHQPTTSRSSTSTADVGMETTTLLAPSLAVPLLAHLESAQAQISSLLRTVNGVSGAGSAAAVNQHSSSSAPDASSALVKDPTAFKGLAASASSHIADAVTLTSNAAGRDSIDVANAAAQSLISMLSVPQSAPTTPSTALVTPASTAIQPKSQPSSTLQLQSACDSLQRENAALLASLVRSRNNIMVYCRVRPGLQDEQDRDAGASSFAGRNSAADGGGGNDLYAHGDSQQDATASRGNTSRRGPSQVVDVLSDRELGFFDKTKKAWRPFAFDRVYGPSSGQDEVLRDAAPLAAAVLDGYNACALAYGEFCTQVEA